MLQIIDDRYSGLQPITPKINAVCVFDVQAAKLAFIYSTVDFVIVLNEKTRKFGYCYSIHEVEEFLNNESK